MNRLDVVVVALVTGATTEEAANDATVPALRADGTVAHAGTFPLAP